MEHKILFWMIVFLGIAELVSAVPSVQLVDTNALKYYDIYYYNTSVHNNLTGLQGGVANEYYHLTAIEYTDLGTLIVGGGLYLNITGGTMQGNINMDGNSLTDVGELIVTGLTTSQDIYPSTDDLYSLGNSTHWWVSAYITDLYASTIDTTDLTSTNINSDNIDSVDLNSTNIETEVVDVETNMTLGGYVFKKVGNDLAIILV